TETPSGTAEILAEGVHAERVVRELSEERSELVYECSINVVGQQHQVGTRLKHLADVLDTFRAQRDGIGVSGVDDEERLHQGVPQRFQVVIGVLPSLLLPNGNEHHLQVVI